MRSAGRRKARLFLLECLCAAFVLSFALSVRVGWAIPTFSGGSAPADEGVRTPSVVDVLLSKQGIARSILKMAFPMVDYMERSRQDLPPAGVLSEIMSYFVGFTANHSQDLVFGGLPGFLIGDFGSLAAASGGNLEDEWSLSQVIYSLPPGSGAIPASVASSSSPLVAIYHTHATESFLPEIGKKNAAEAFSSDSSLSVVRVGEMLSQELQQRYRIPTLHSDTIHDSDSRIGAYYRSEATVKAILKKYPTCQVLVDIHRDSQPRSITAVTIRGKPYARLMIVIGTDNPNWIQNHAFAQKIVEKLEEGYPGVSRGIFYESAVYNQKYSPMAILVECGGVGNTLAECKNSVEALAWAIACAILPVAPPRP